MDKSTIIKSHQPRRNLAEFPIFIASAVLVALGGAIVLMAVLGFADRIVFFLQMAFFLSASTALWCVFTQHWLTEYAVWTMYLSAIALAILMLQRTLFSTRRSNKPPRFQDSRAEH